MDFPLYIPMLDIFVIWNAWTKQLLDKANT